MPTGRARNISSIANRTNNCGGPKKAGLASSIGGNAVVMRNIATQGVNIIPVVKCGSGGRGCPRNFSNNPGGQACGGVGRMAQLATRGIVPPGGRGGGGVPRETITLVTARAQGGVRANQDLVLRTDDYEEDGDNISGLRISNNQTFTVAAGGTITFADPIVANGIAVGIRVETGGAFIQQGGAITFRGAITGNLPVDFVTGIYNDTNGTFRQEGGAITFEGDIAGENRGQGIINLNATFSQTGGTITFRGDITGTADFANGIFNNDNATFTQQAGAITFRGAITGGGRFATGINNDNNATFRQEGGAITFEGDIAGENRGQGISNGTDTFSQTGGTITFRGDISGVANATGISNGTGTFTQQAGAITFEGAITSGDLAGDNATGIFNGTGTFSQAGTITFQGLLTSGDLTTAGVRLVDDVNNAIASFTVNGAIRFPGNNNTLLYANTNFNPDPADTRFDGTGTITYNSGANTYYQDL